MYPRLMIDDEYGMVVLFETEDVGTVLNAGTSPHEVGDHENYGDDDWNDYTGTITLGN